jgi:uncharacterized metal-binding protein YceD (DUF177 family)
MPERQSAKQAPISWRVLVAVEDVGEDGQRFDLVADPDLRAAVARTAGLRDLPRLEANFEVTRHGAGGLRVVGQVSATVHQACVVTLESVANEVAEEVNVLFLPQSAATRENGTLGTPDASFDEAEPLIGGSVDLGALATEFLILGLDPYPRLPGAVFQPPRDAVSDEGPFAALAALKKDGDGL